jgi:excisionase family DNA binding protein
MMSISTEDESLETPKQLAARVGLKERQVRHLIHTRRIEYVMVGSRPLIPRSAWTRFLEASTVKPCPDATKVRSYDGSKSGSASTSSGPSAAGAASARLARQTANELKRFLGSGSTREAAEQGRVIPLKSS